MKANAKKLLSWRNISDWKTTVLGLIIVGLALASVFYGVASWWPDAIAGTCLGLVLMFAPNDLMGLIKRIFGEKLSLVLLLGCASFLSCKGSEQLPQQQQENQIESRVELPSDNLTVRFLIPTAENIRWGSDSIQKQEFDTLISQKSGRATASLRIKKQPGGAVLAEAKASCDSVVIVTKHRYLTYCRHDIGQGEPPALRKEANGSESLWGQFTNGMGWQGRLVFLIVALIFGLALIMALPELFSSMIRKLSENIRKSFGHGKV